MPYDNDMSGVLFRAKEKKSDRSPEYSGSCEIDGEEYWISAWVKESKKDGSKFFSLAFSPKEQRAEERRRPAKRGNDRRQSADEGSGGDIPF